MYQWTTRGFDRDGKVVSVRTGADPQRHMALASIETATDDMFTDGPAGSSAEVVKVITTVEKADG